MLLPLTNLDDRTFDDLVLELRSLIPRYAKTWTNHNVSDPGITFIELFSWMAEMVMYRLNHINDRTQRTFLELLGLPPAGPEAEITFALKVPKAALLTTFAIPQGTRVAAWEEKTGAEIVFETRREVGYQPDNWDEDLGLWLFKAAAINTIIIAQETLGTSDGSPHQEFFLQGPLHLDPEQESYAGNPVVFVGEGPGSQWQYQNDLLESTGDDQHFTAAALSGLIRFGDDIKGRIPPAGSKITCTYRRLGGKMGNVDAGRITRLKDPLPGIDPLAVSVFNEYSATGGVDQENLDDLLARGLALLQDPYRAVADDDFSHLARQAAPGKVARVEVLGHRNLESALSQAEGHVSLVVLPARDFLGLPQEPMAFIPDTQAVIYNRSSTVMGAALASPEAKRLNRTIARFFDARRLITTIVHVVPPKFTPLRLQISLRAKPGVNPPDLKRAVIGTIGDFLDPFAGWEDGRGWPFARPVYRSELYQQIESLADVDHIMAMSMNEDPVTAKIAVPENTLVCVDELSLTMQ